MLAKCPELEVTMEAVKNYWNEFPVPLKMKITFAYSIKRMLKISEVNIQDKTDFKTLESAVSEMLDTLLIHLGQQEWDGSDPSHSGVCVQAFRNLQGYVDDLQAGNLPDDTELLAKAASDCEKILEVGCQFTQVQCVYL